MHRNVLLLEIPYTGTPVVRVHADLMVENASAKWVHVKHVELASIPTNPISYRVKIVKRVSSKTVGVKVLASNVLLANIVVNPDKNCAHDAPLAITRM